MRIVDPISGRGYIEKRRVRYDVPGHPRELTFSCYRHYQFLNRDRTRQWLSEAIENARRNYAFQLWAYVFMPEHVHLVVYPGEFPERMSGFLQAIKQPVARNAIQILSTAAPDWLERITVREGRRVRRRFWQPGGGYDRNVTSLKTMRDMIDYIHNNPVRRGLVARAEDWEWSSARWFLGIRPVKLEMDPDVLVELARQ